MLKRRNPRFSSAVRWKFFTSLLGLAAGASLAIVGTFKYSGQTELTLGSAVFSFVLPAEFWIFVGAVVAISIAALGFFADPEFGWTVFSVVSGGLTMVLGYFIYQMFFIGWLFGIEVVAIAEIPVNIGQMIVGATVALPAAKIVWRAFPQLKKSSK